MTTYRNGFKQKKSVKYPVLFVSLACNKEIKSMNQKVVNGLLYPAMHKFYSALNSLEQFEKRNDFFNNISSLDNFFSEYRNITFVLQKSLAHTEYEDIYNENREKYLLNDTCKWFVEKRNEVLKQHPFNLEKRIIITIYSPQTSIALPERVFTIENDVEYTTIIESLRAFFMHINPIEVYFSVEFSFYEKGHDKELYEDFITGISNMKTFILAMKDSIKENCKLCNQLQQKIEEMKYHNVPKNMLFIDDYVYYCEKNKFEKAARMEISLPVLSMRTSLASYCNFLKKDSEEKRNIFNNFIIMHIQIFSMQKTLMPTFMIIYRDETFELKSFHASIKTTMYRKINDIAKKIEKDNIKSIFLVTEMLNYTNKENNYNAILNINSSERIKYKTSESLCFFMLDESLQYKSYYFNSEKIDDMEYLVSILHNPSQTYPTISFLQPIKDEFKRLIDR